MDTKVEAVMRTINCFGPSEARIAELLEDLLAPDGNPAVVITCSEAVVRVHVNARAATETQAEADAEATVTHIRQRLGPLVFGEGGDTLADVVGSLLVERRASVSTAESSTGGFLAKCITDVPGSSRYYVGGFVTYSNA